MIYLWTAWGQGRGWGGVQAVHVAVCLTLREYLSARALHAARNVMH